MSLFQVCPLWTTKYSHEVGEGDIFNLYCCRLGLELNEKDYIVVGTYSGHLSIFYPTSEISEDGSPKGFKPTDLTLETKLKRPIVGLTSGKFTGSMKNEKINQLVILHPMNICIYNITTAEGVAEHGTQSSLQLATEHKLAKFAFSLCKGNFGGVKGREFLCVTHMDGSLTFFEQDGISYQCTLSGDKTIPGEVFYVPRTDSFVRVNSYWELESYSYQDLSQSSGSAVEITPHWSICIGEAPIDMAAVQVTNSRTTIVILGERNLIGISDDGKLQFIKKLEYTAVCFHSFVVGWYWEPNARLITAIVSESASLLIYDETKLIWAAQLDHVPVSIKRSNLKDLPAGIVTLTADGTINVGYLGTEPHVFKVPPLNMQEMNFEKAQKELVELEKEIKQGIDFTDIGLINASAEKDLEFEVKVSPNLEKCTYEVAEDLKLDDNLSLMCSVTVHFKSRINVDQMQISFSFADGIRCSESTRTFNDVPAQTSEFLEVWFYLGDHQNIASVQVQTIISYINKQSIPRVLNRQFCLPLRMFYKIAPPQKEGAFKITLSAESNAKSKVHKMSAIFPEFVNDNEAQALGLMSVWNEKVITIVAAKNTNRFRIQSDSIEAITPLLDMMKSFFQNMDVPKQNLHKSETSKKKQKEQQRTNPVTITPYIPITEISQRIDNHYNTQVEIKKQTALMDALWNQFKLFQRSLQSKSEGASTSGIMMLIEKNYDDLVTEGDKLLSLRNTEKTKRSDLSCAIGLARNIVSCLNLPERTVEGLVAALAFPVEDWSEKSWEETAAPALDMLTHYGPLSRNKNTPMDNNPSLNSTNFDFDRFKRHLTSLMERACRIALDPKQRHDNFPARDSAPSKESTPRIEDTNKTVSNVVADNENNIVNKQQSMDKTNEFEEEDDELLPGKSKGSDWLNGDLPQAEIMLLTGRSRVHTNEDSPY